MIRPYILVGCLFFCFFAISICENIDTSVCDPNDIECHEKQKYKKEHNVESNKETNTKWKKYLDKIDEALKNYKECEHKTNCSCYFGRIKKDLEPFKNGITKEVFNKAADIQRNSYYQIIKNKLYRRDTNEMFPARNAGVEHFLLEIIDKLPNMEIALNTRDWPQTVRWQDALPVFSFSKVDAENYDIMYPNWAFWEGGPAVWPIYPDGLGRWDEHIVSLQKAANKWKWNKKLTQAFFRGSRTSDERDPLVLLSRKYPKLVDAQYTKNQAWRSPKDTLDAEPATEIKLEDHCKYKFLFNFRGVAASFRFRHLFLCDSVVFHVGDQWLEFFYDELKPWVHYIPVRQDLKDAQELIEFAVENDDIVRQIAERGRDFILKNLKMEDVNCYWEELLKEYAKLVKHKVKRNKDFIKIKKKN